MNPEDFNQIFPKGCFGSFFQEDVSKTKIFSIQCSLDAVAIINVLRTFQQSTFKDNSFDLTRFVADHDGDPRDFEDAIKQLDVYHRVSRVIGRDLREAMMKNRGHTFVAYKMGESFFFDIIVHILVKHMQLSAEFRRAMAEPESRKLILEQVMNQILEKTQEDFASYSDPAVWLGDLGKFTLNFKKHEVDQARKLRSSQEDTADHTYELDMAKHRAIVQQQPEALASSEFYSNFLGMNSGLMLYGDKGAGKSGVLNYVATWAWKNGFILLKMPSAHHVMHTPCKFVRHEESKLFLQFDHAKELLDDFVATNEKILASIPVDLSLYGKFNITGCHEDEPTPVPNTYDPWTQSHLYDSDKYYLEGEKQSILHDQRMWKLRPLKERLPAPQTLLELCKFADTEVEFATNIFAEVIEQLQNQESYPVLVCVDDYNWMYRRSCFPSFRYDNKKLKGRVPPYHMALGRMFMRMDGHRFKNGFKVVASSNFHLYKHVFTPEKINWPAGFSRQLKGMTLDEFRLAVYNYTNSKLLTETSIDERMIQQFYVESQGNWGNLLQLINRRYQCIELNTFRIDKRKFLGNIVN